MKCTTLEGAKETFWSMVNTLDLSPDELKNSKLFFSSQTVQDVIDCGRQDNTLIYSIVEFLGDALFSLNKYRSCLCGYLIGVYAESGYGAQTADRKLMQCFCVSIKQCYDLLQQCQTNGIDVQDHLNNPNACTLDTDGMFSISKQAVHIWHAMPLLALGVMSRISEQRVLRDLLRQDTSLCSMCEDLNGLLGTVGFVPTILNMAEDETVLFLCPEKELGYKVRLQEIDSNFLMFTLFQYALYHAGELEELGVSDYSYNPLLEKAALHIPLEEGEAYPEPLSDKNCFGYHPYTAWTNGSLTAEDLVWGEGILHHIPKVDGHFVILIDKPQIIRFWSNAFIASTHSRLCPRLTIEYKLTRDEVQGWICKIQDCTMK